MRPALLSRYHLHPMQLGHHLIEFSPRSSPTQNSRKRSSATVTHAFSHPHPFRQQSNTDPFPVSPPKVPRSASVRTPQEAMRAFGGSSKRHPPGAHGGSRSGKNKKARQPGVSSFHTSTPALPREDDPIHDAEYINRVEQKVPLKEAWKQNPKSPLSNFLHQLGVNPPTYCRHEITIRGEHGWRQVYCCPFPRSLH